MYGICCNVNHIMMPTGAPMAMALAKDRVKRGSLTGRGGSYELEGNALSRLTHSPALMHVHLLNYGEYRLHRRPPLPKGATGQRANRYQGRVLTQERATAVSSDQDAGAERRIALEILQRAPIDFSRRTSYGWEQRTETVLALWSSGARVALKQARDDRISFALRDHYELAQPTCGAQFARLLAQRGAPEAILVGWSYEADWEGKQPFSEAGRYRLTWPETANLLSLPAIAPKSDLLSLGPC